ncbi:MAG: hypothetical protein HN790_01845 [Methylococcales bacterium]|jgi:hypothetical protein|nr:hypothetical protein [Methylococcales bacterium]
MKQSVNLLPASYTAGTPIINIYVIVAVFVIESLALAAYGYQQSSISNNLQISDIDIQTEYDDKSIALEELKENYVPKAKDPKLNVRISQLRQEKSGKSSILKILETQSFGTVKPPSQFLKAIAEHQVQGLWFTDIHILQSQNQLQLRGETLAAEYITDYLSGLANADAFTGMSFSSLELKQNKKIPSQLLFTLSTQPVVKKEVAAAAPPAPENAQLLQALVNSKAGAQ